MVTSEDDEGLPYGENFHAAAEIRALCTAENLEAVRNTGFAQAKLVWTEHEMASYRARP